MITQALNTFRTGFYTVVRTPGTRVNGVWTAGTAATTDDVPMAIQPLEGKDLKVVPQGAAAEDFRLVLCAFDLKIKDVITYNSEPWTVYREQRWTLRGASWTRAYITRNALTVT